MLNECLYTNLRGVHVDVRLCEWLLPHGLNMVAMEITLNFNKYNTALYAIFINKPLEQSAVSLTCVNKTE